MIDGMKVMIDDMNFIQICLQFKENGFSLMDCILLVLIFFFVIVFFEGF